MSERDYLLAAIERCGKRAKIAKGNLDRFTLMPGDASSERTYRKLKEVGVKPPSTAEEFLSKYGGMIFRLRYTVPGAQRTLLEYFSPSRLKAQLADASAQRREFD